MSVRRDQICAGLRIRYTNPLTGEVKEGIVSKAKGQSFDVTFDDGTIKAGNPLTYQILRHFTSIDPLDMMIQEIFPHG